MTASAQLPSPNPTGGQAAQYGVTFGVHNQTTPWGDRRRLAWAELAALLTRHEVGPKEGRCIVPAVFRGTERKKRDAMQIDVAFLDSDAGSTLDEICTAIRARGWAAIVSSTHSHLATQTRAKRSNWDRFLGGSAAHPDSAGAFLRGERGYLPRIAQGARLVSADPEYAIFEHQPCPKFRIAIPLARPWLAGSYDDQRAADAAWKGCVEALATALGLSHDQSCTDTSRLFYLPRRPVDGPPPETAVIDGVPCDIFALGRPTSPARARSRRSRAGAPDADPPESFCDPATGEIFDLIAWAHDQAGGFQIVSALRARRPDLFIGKVADGTKHHIRCANEGEHTQAGADVATFIVNAGDSDTKGFVYHCRHGHCDGRDRLFFLRRMLEQGWLTTADLQDPQFLTGDAHERPTIRVSPGDLSEAVDAAEQALIDAGLGLYQRGAFVVRPGRVRISVSEGREVTASRILEVKEHSLLEAMTMAAVWERYDGRSGGWQRIDAPLKVATVYLQRIGRWRLPTLVGLIEAPTLRGDGSILASPGYDAATGLLLDTGGTRYPSIPDRPSREDARQALELLRTLISTFPFVDEPSRSVALSAILTACIRRSLPTAPMHAFAAPTAGSGKSKLVDLASVIASGREAGVIAQGKTEEELEKRLGALLLSGDQVIAVDNCEAPLGGEFLCSMLTQRVVRPRILGRSEAPELPANAFVTATGNNLELVGDMTRRAVLCRLDPRTERPELRQFSSDPVIEAMKGRGRYLIAALTVLRAYHIAGRPATPTPLGSFETWSGWVRGALLWLGAADPVATMEQAREMDPRLDALTAVMSQWRAAIGTQPVSVREIIDHATRQRTPAALGALSMGRPEFVHPEFRDALLAVAGEGGVVNSRRLGKWLAANKDRLVGDARIIQGGLNMGIMRWRVEAHDAARAAA